MASRFLGGTDRGVTFHFFCVCVHAQAWGQWNSGSGAYRSNLSLVKTKQSLRNGSVNPWLKGAVHRAVKDDFIRANRRGNSFSGDQQVLALLSLGDSQYLHFTLGICIRGWQSFPISLSSLIATTASQVCFSWKGWMSSVLGLLYRRGSHSLERKIDLSKTSQLDVRKP